MLAIPSQITVERNKLKLSKFIFNFQFTKNIQLKIHKNSLSYYEQKIKNARQVKNIPMLRK
jgi:hypothetical protein